MGSHQDGMHAAPRGGRHATSDLGQHLNPAGPAANLAAFDALQAENTADMTNWINWLRQFHVFFCTPLDLDYSMLRAFPVAYQLVEPGRQGPSPHGDPRTAVLGETGRGDLYAADRIRCCAGTATCSLAAASPARMSVF